MDDEREGLLIAATQAQSLAEIEELRDRLAAWDPDDAEVARARERLDRLERALEQIGLSELPPTSGAR
ncbi:MAG: hypothetical protein AB7V42_11880 [Thermoleophilia bacterium]